MPPRTTPQATTTLLNFITPPMRSSTRSTCTTCIHQRRQLHKRTSKPSVPDPTPFVPDTSTFLSLIGRALSKHASKIPSWSSLFTLSSLQLRELGIEPARSRRYLLHWRNKFRKGEFGIGGDLQHVQDGVAELRVCEVPARPEAAAATYVSTRSNPGMQKLILNLPPGSTEPPLREGQSTFELQKPRGMKLKNGHAIVGSYVQPVKGTNGSVATLKVQEGLWEHKRGHKVDGGERRKAEVRFKRRVAERRAATR